MIQNEIMRAKMNWGRELTKSPHTGKFWQWEASWRSEKQDPDLFLNKTISWIYFVVMVRAELDWQEEKGKIRGMGF